MSFFQRIWSIILMAAFFVLLCSCSVNLDREVDTENHFNICVIGNSYSNDSFDYVPFILLEYGYTCTIHIYCRSGGSLQDLCNEWGSAQLYSKGQCFHYHIDTRTDRKWRLDKSISVDDMLSLDKWDIISLQQSSTSLCDYDSYFPFLGMIVDRINITCSYPFELTWLIAYNRANDYANDLCLDVQRRVLSDYHFSLLLPVATAIFSCQLNSDIAELGDSKYKRLYAGDNIHLQEGLPRYIAALSVVQALFNKFSPHLSVIGNQLRPDVNWLKSINSLSTNGKPVGITEDNCLLAQIAAFNAGIASFSISPVL